MRGLYVTGTDTGIGKTVASTALLYALRSRGLRAVGMKPVASGCVRTADGWRNDDALALLAASDPHPEYRDVNPYALPAAIAPQLAARDAGVSVTLAPILDAHARLAVQADAIVVEGVGGWAAPLADQLMQADLVRALRLPVLLVVGLRLGCLNHASLSARAIAADGCTLAGWLAVDIDPTMSRADDNFELLSHCVSAPCWGRLPYRAVPDPREFSQLLHIPVG